MKPNQPDASPRPSTESDLLTRIEAAALLKISTETCKRWEKSGYLTPIRCGPKLIRYQRDEVEGLASGRAPAAVAGGQQALLVPHEVPAGCSHVMEPVSNQSAFFPGSNGGKGRVALITARCRICGAILTQ